MSLRRRSGPPAGYGSVPTSPGSRRRPALWLLSGLGLVTFFLLLGAGSASAETDPATPSDPGILGTVGEVGAGLTGAVTEQVAPVTDAVRDEVVAPVVQPVHDAVEPVVQPVRDQVLEPVRDDVVKPVTKPVRDAVKPVTDPIVTPVRNAVEPVVAPVRDEIVRPTLEPVVGSGGATNLPADPSTDPSTGTSTGTVTDPTIDTVVVPEAASTEAPTGTVVATTVEPDQSAAADTRVSVVPTGAATDNAAAPSTTDTVAAPTADDRPVTDDRGGDDRKQPTPFEPTSGKAVVLTSSSAHSGSQSGAGDNPTGAAVAVLPGSRADWHRATWTIRVVPADHALPSSVAYSPGFSPD